MTGKRELTFPITFGTDIFPFFFSPESAFDSNQSVAGSSVEILSESSSQISQISQTSQSSIEVIEMSRKPSEERRISQVPGLETIEDDGPKSDENILEETLTKSTELKPKVILTIGNVNLTESSSSGSVCESVVTAYEQSGKKNEAKLDGIFKTSSLLLSKTPKPKKEAEPENFASKPIHFNYEDLSVVDHRVKLFLFQNVLEENDEKLMWLVKCLVIEDEASSVAAAQFALVIMTTKKIYVLKIVGEESEDIGAWVKKTTICLLDRVEVVRELPAKAGFSFVLRGTTNVHVLLQDGNVTDRLKKHIANSSKISVGKFKDFQQNVVKFPRKTLNF